MGMTPRLQCTGVSGAGVYGVLECLVLGQNGRHLRGMCGALCREHWKTLRNTMETLGTMGTMGTLGNSKEN